MLACSVLYTKVPIPRLREPGIHLITKAHKNLLLS